MTEYSWIPGLIVLGGGLAAGLFMALKLRRAGKSARADQEQRDLELRIKDLKGRRDDLYRRLRDESAVLTDSDRRQLEQTAARVLRDLDEAGVSQKKHKKAAPEERKAGKARDVAPQEGTRPRRPLLAGFALGAGLVAVVGLLVYWAVRDTAGTGTPSAGMGTGTGAGMQDGAHPDATFVSREAQAEHDSLRQQLDANPGDLMARKRLALLLVANDQFVPAFQEARTLLENDPDDIDGLYVEAVVRIQMGQGPSAMAMLDRVIELFPQHVQAWGWKGVVFYQSGDLHAAIDAWENGVQAAGGQHPELEEMLAAAREEDAAAHAAESSSGAGLGASPADWAMMAAAGPESAPESAPAPAPAAPSDGFGLRLEIAAGAQAPPGVLFVALRPVGGGPPIAVRRISQPAFPMNLTLTADDSMMGAALPDEGLLSVRLDQDGDVTAASPGDLVAEATVRSGQNTTLTLEVQ